MEKSFPPSESLVFSSNPKFSEKKSEKEKKSSKSKKILKVKKYHSYFEKKQAKNAEETNSLLNFSLDSRNEKKRVYTKRTTEKIRRWTKEEAEQYEKFIDMYSDIFNESGSKRVTKVFIQMSQFIGTKTPSQCRSHHQKFFKRLQRARLLAAGHIINEDDFKKKRKNNTKKLKAKKEAALAAEQQAKSAEKLLDEPNTTKESFETKIEPAVEKIEDNKMQSSTITHSNCSTNNPLENNEAAQPYIINNNYYYNNNYYCENQYVYNYGFPAGAHPANNDTKIYLRKPSYYDDKEFAYLLDTKQRRKSSFSFFNNNNQQTEQDFNNFEKIFLSTAIPQSNFVHPELFKPEIPYNDDQKKKIGCASPKKEDIIKGV